MGERYHGMVEAKGSIPFSSTKSGVEAAMNKQSVSKIALPLFWHAVDIVCYGVALHFLWGWFGQGTFHTPALTWATSFGLVLIARMIVGHHGEDDRDVTFHNLLTEALTPALFTEAGFLIHHFMGM